MSCRHVRCRQNHQVALITFILHVRDSDGPHIHYIVRIAYGTANDGPFGELMDPLRVNITLPKVN